MICPTCRAESTSGAHFCAGCGRPLLIACQQCRAEVSASARFCPQCGHPLEEAGPTAPAQPEIAQYVPAELLAKLHYARAHGGMLGERRTVTMLFCDVKGSTAAASSLDPEEWAELMKGAFQCLIAPVYRYEGTLARLMGDAILAFFGAPIAHEDDPQRAVLAGLEILQSIGAYRDTARGRWGVDLAVRIGINTGLVVVGEMGSDLRLEYTAMGDAINVAARMEQTARPGTVQITEQTHRLIAPLFDTEDLGYVEVKGKAEPVRAYAVLRPKAAPGQLRGIQGLRSPLVGRDAQLAKLKTLVAALQQGQGQIASVIADAGLGKSRLVAELRQFLVSTGVLDTADTGAPPAERQVTWYEGRSLSYRTSTPYAPVVDLLTGVFGLSPSDTDPRKYDRIVAKLNEISLGHVDATAPFLASLLGIKLLGEPLEKVRYLEPPILRGKVFAAVRDLMTCLARSRPLVLVFEDLHWADSNSLDLLEQLLPVTEQAPLMLLAVFRPQQQEPSWKFHEVSARDYGHRYTPITLEPLTNDESRELVANLLRIEGLPEKVRRLILTKSEGNPFFVEEVIRSLLDAKLVVREGDYWRATRDIQDVSLPDTIAGVITSRLDRLDEDARRVIQSAAVIGREFQVATLADIADGTEALDRALGELHSRGLIREKADGEPRTYSFKHALVQEAAYATLLLRRRRELHQRVAVSIERADLSRVNEIGHHYFEAREYAKALPYLVAGGDHAARAYATREAIGFYRQALGIIDSAVDATLARRAYEGLGGALTFGNDTAGALAIYEQMLLYARAHSDMPMEVSALNKMAFVLSLRLGQIQEAEQRLVESERIANQCKDYPGLVELHMTHCYINTATGRFETAMDHLAASARLGQDLGLGEARLFAMTHIVQVLMMMTRFEDSFRTAQEALQIARELGHRQYEADLLAMGVPFYHLRNGDLDAAQDAAERAVHIAREINALYPEADASYLLGAIAQMRGDYQQALRHQQAALDAARAAGVPYVEVTALCALGTTYIQIGPDHRAKAAQLHAQALYMMQHPLGIAMGAMAWTDLGFCALELGDAERAYEFFQKGLTVPSAPMYMVRPQLLLGCALVALAHGQPDEAVRYVGEARQYAEERKMRHVYPLVDFVDAHTQAARRDAKKALDLLQQAEREALGMQLRPLLGQSRAAEAELLAQLGRAEEADGKRREAQQVVDEIAGLFVEESLRRHYRESAGRKLGTVA